MSETIEGILYPEIDINECIECGKCMHSCHQLQHIERAFANRVYAAWAKDSSIRSSSSSGGVFFVIAESIIKRGGVVYGAAYGLRLKVRHIRVDNISDLMRLKGSKYIQSDISGVYSNVKDDLDNGYWVLFSGTPCQVAGLKTYLKKNYETLICIDLICHGVPPQKAFDRYINKIGIDSSLAHDFRFRYLKGWGFELACNNHILSPYNSYYLKAFTKGYMFINACYSCKYSTLDRVGDLTLADFWNIGKYAPFNYSVMKGVSMVLQNTKKGEYILHSVEQYLSLHEREIEEAIRGNHNLTRATIYPKERINYIKDSYTLDKKDLIQKYHLKPNWKEYLRPIYRRLYFFFLNNN